MTLPDSSLNESVGSTSSSPLDGASTDLNGGLGPLLSPDTLSAHNPQQNSHESSHDGGHADSDVNNEIKESGIPSNNGDFSLNSDSSGASMSKYNFDSNTNPPASDPESTLTSSGHVFDSKQINNTHSWTDTDENDESRNDLDDSISGGTDAPTSDLFNESVQGPVSPDNAHHTSSENLSTENDITEAIEEGVSVSELDTSSVDDTGKNSLSGSGESSSESSVTIDVGGEIHTEPGNGPPTPSNSGHLEDTAGQPDAEDSVTVSSLDHTISGDLNQSGSSSDQGPGGHDNREGDEDSADKENQEDRRGRRSSYPFNEEEDDDVTKEVESNEEHLPDAAEAHPNSNEETPHTNTAEESQLPFDSEIHTNTRTSLPVEEEGHSDASASISSPRCSVSSLIQMIPIETLPPLSSSTTHEGSDYKESLLTEFSVAVEGWSRLGRLVATELLFTSEPLPSQAHSTIHSSEYKLRPIVASFVSKLDSHVHVPPSFCAIESGSGALVHYDGLMQLSHIAVDKRDFSFLSAGVTQFAHQRADVARFLESQSPALAGFGQPIVDSGVAGAFFVLFSLLMAILVPLGVRLCLSTVRVALCVTSCGLICGPRGQAGRRRSAKGSSTSSIPFPTVKAFNGPVFTPNLDTNASSPSGNAPTGPVGGAGAIPGGLPLPPLSALPEELRSRLLAAGLLKRIDTISTTNPSVAAGSTRRSTIRRRTPSSQPGSTAPGTDVRSMSAAPLGRRAVPVPPGTETPSGTRGVPLFPLEALDKAAEDLPSSSTSSSTSISTSSSLRSGPSALSSPPLAQGPNSVPVSTGASAAVKPNLFFKYSAREKAVEAPQDLSRSLSELEGAPVPTSTTNPMDQTQGGVLSDVTESGATRGRAQPPLLLPLSQLSSSNSLTASANNMNDSEGAIEEEGPDSIAVSNNTPPTPLAFHVVPPVVNPAAQGPLLGTPAVMMSSPLSHTQSRSHMRSHTRHVQSPAMPLHTPSHSHAYGGPPTTSSSEMPPPLSSASLNKTMEDVSAMAEVVEEHPPREGPHPPTFFDPSLLSAAGSASASRSRAGTANSFSSLSHSLNHPLSQTMGQLSSTSSLFPGKQPSSTTPTSNPITFPQNPADSSEFSMASMIPHAANVDGSSSNPPPSSNPLSETMSLLSSNQGFFDPSNNNNDQLIQQQQHEYDQQQQLQQQQEYEQQQADYQQQQLQYEQQQQQPFEQDQLQYDQQQQQYEQQQQQYEQQQLEYQQQQQYEQSQLEYQQQPEHTVEGAQQQAEQYQQEQLQQDQNQQDQYTQEGQQQQEVPLSFLRYDEEGYQIWGYYYQSGVDEQGNPVWGEHPMERRVPQPM